MNGTNRKDEFFTEGRGRGFEMKERPPIEKTNKARTEPIEIDLDSLNRPGVGPVNFDKMNGKILPKIQVGGIMPGGVSDKPKTGY